METLQAEAMPNVGEKVPRTPTETDNPRLDISIEHDAYIAGQINVVRLLITNPYDEKIEITKIKIPQSSTFREHRETSEISDNKKANDNNDASSFLSTSLAILGKIVSMITPFGAVFTDISVDIPRSKSKFVVEAKSGARVLVNRPPDDYGTIIVSAAEDSVVKFTSFQEKGRPEDDNSPQFTIHPRSTIVVPAVVRANHWMMFTPQRYGLTVEILFKIGEKSRTQVVTTHMDIRPPLTSILSGAVIGGFLGSVVASLSRSSASFYEGSIQVGTSVLMSVIAAISLSRRGSGQAFITVEDFYGAFFVGSLIGYGGASYFERAIMPAQTNGTHD